MATNTKINTVFALLAKDQRALDVVREAERPGYSSHPVVRGVIDQKLGFIALGTSRPSDEIDERIIKVETPNAERALINLLQLQGVRAVSLNRTHLAQ